MVLVNIAVDGCHRPVWWGACTGQRARSPVGSAVPVVPLVVLLARAAISPSRSRSRSCSRRSSHSADERWWWAALAFSGAVLTREPADRHRRRRSERGANVPLASIPDARPGVPDVAWIVPGFVFASWQAVIRDRDRPLRLHRGRRGRDRTVLRAAQVPRRVTSTCCMAFTCPACCKMPKRSCLLFMVVFGRGGAEEARAPPHPNAGRSWPSADLRLDVLRRWCVAGRRVACRAFCRPLRVGDPRCSSALAVALAVPAVVGGSVTACSRRCSSSASCDAKRAVSASPCGPCGGGPSGSTSSSRCDHGRWSCSSS